MPGKSDFEKASFGGEEKGEKRARGGGEGRGKSFNVSLLDWHICDLLIKSLCQ